MGLFKKNKMCIEEEIDFLYENDLLLLERWQKAKADKKLNDMSCYCCIFLFLVLGICQSFFSAFDKVSFPISLLLPVFLLAIVRSDIVSRLNFYSAILFFKKKAYQQEEEQKDLTSL